MSVAFSGVVTPLITPFLSSSEPDPGSGSEIDTFRLAALVRWQARSGVSAVILGSPIGEGPTLTRDERVALVKAAGPVKGRMQVLAHIGTPDTARAVEMARDARGAGADGLVLATPPYNKPTARGILAHIAAVADAAAGLPILVEFDEARTKTHLTVCEMAEMIRVAGVAGLVDHSPNPLHLECLSRARPDTCFLAGHEPAMAACGLMGAHGVSSAAANVAPHLVVALWQAVADGDGAGARRLQERLTPLFQLVEAEGVPALKDLAQDALGCETTVRLPLHALCRSARQAAARIAVDLETIGCPPPSRMVRHAPVWERAS
ncbi:dihydrodipicolinate synthase family protein [Aureimonas sp. AU4]|uniref:dihydrodipicolinate synthase family protein n=1 Tax=Aureimonas sp. AU4 TaxID=1638163 RepID=UPI0007835215|nr:dihydrodipicolinate synthase family protein [Aureimonas sp. AU4]